MVVTDRDRHELFVALQSSLGDRPADTLMALLPPVDWSEFARKSDVATLEARMDARFDQVDARFERMEARFEQVDARFAQVDARISGLIPRFILAQIPVLLALVGLVWTIARMNGAG